MTILGVVIGITSVVIVMSAGQGMKQLIVGQLETFGSDFIEVEVKVPNTSKTSTDNAMSMAMGVTITTLKLSDLDALLKLPNIANGYGGLMGQEPISYGGQMKRAMIWGNTASFDEVDQGEVEFGRFYTDEEDKSLARVAVLGSKMKERFFGDDDAIGKNVKIGKHTFKVIGVMKSRGAVMFMDMDNMVFMPVRTLQKLVMGVDYVSFIFTKMADPSQEAVTIDNITNLMRERHDITDPNKDDFAVTGMSEGMAMMDTVVGGITLLLVALAGISLLVGGVGIMNIMYVSVTERTYEIGLRKAVGATGHNILWQFLGEAIVITFWGGVIGVLLGLAATYGLAQLPVLKNMGWEFTVSWSGIIIACVFSIVIGLIFGIYPAKRAASLDPIDALRYE